MKILCVEGMDRVASVQVIGGSRTVGMWVWSRWVQRAHSVPFWVLLRKHVGVELG